MVGLKTFWILISALFLLGACVPQTKQTQCKSNEAFNAAVRTCVPVVGGPSSFINIASYSPLSAVTKFKDDVTTMRFEITVSNPYNQSYTVSWEKNFNGNVSSMCSNALECSFSANYLANTLGEFGTHVLMAKVKDSNGVTVSTHNFEIRLVNQPKPIINTASFIPEKYAFDVLPSDPRVEFSFKIKNNNATIAGSDNYKTTWTIVKNGANILTDIDPFTDFTPTGINTAYFGTSPTPDFNPATLGVGSYIVRAVVSNDVPGEVVDEHQWNVVVKEPDLAKVTTISSPAPGVTITAYNNVAYNHPSLLSWVYGGASTQPNFCIDIDDRDGTYAGDGKSIQVRFYLDSLGGDICTKKTLDTPGTQTVCLIDAEPCAPYVLPTNLFDTSLLVFANANSTSTQIHKVTARLFDEATSYEFQRSNVVPSNGSYPIEWIVNNKPQNAAPAMGFGTIKPTGCTSSGAYTQSNCMVDQGTDFTVSFNVTDDFYTASANPGEFQWDVKLKYNGGDLTTSDTAMNTSCSKAFGTATTLPATHTSGYGTTQWTCRLNVPHHTSSGPLNPSAGTFQVIATMQDQGSPVGGAGQISQSLSWNLVVKETNGNAPIFALDPQSILVASSHVAKTATGTILDNTDTNSYATEKEVVTFRLNVSDKEVDDFKYRISLCTDNTAACTTSIPVTSPTYVDLIRSTQTPADANPLLFTGLLYTLPEDLLIGLHTTPIDVDTATSRLVYFKVDVEDKPSVATTTVSKDFKIFSFYVRNFNPAPVINTALASPAIGTTKVVYSGFPFTIDPGSASDASVPASERNLQYQWYADNGGGFTAITGATSRVLRYTPGNATTNITLRICVGDGTAAHTTALTGACYGNWTVTPKRYLESLTATGSSSLNNELAVWYDSTNTFPNTQVIYSAYVDTNNDVFVEKTIKNTSGNIILSTNTIRFSALAVGVPSLVTNLSIAGSADSVYVAYIASSTSAPSTMVPRVRRIDKNFDLAVPAKTKANLDHPAPFGFNYVHYALSGSCTGGGATCTFTQSNGQGGPATIAFGDRLTTGDTLNINGEIFTAAASPTGSNQVCDASACATVNSMATNVRDKINNSTLARLHGITARASGGTVELYGQYNLDYLDFDGSISGVPSLVSGSTGLGKIFISGGRWNLPMINSSLGGPSQNNITVISGTADFHLRSLGLALSTNNDLLEMGKTAYFDAKLNLANELVFARISAELGDSGRVSLFRYIQVGSAWQIFDKNSTPSPTDNERQTIFGTYNFEYVKLATNAVSNSFYYVIGREKAIEGAKYHIGRYNIDLDSTATPSENFITAKLLTTDSTSTFITDTKLKFPDLVSVPGFSEARIFFHSVGGGATAYPRVARWRSDDMISCGICASLNGSLTYQSTSRIGISQIADDITLGEAGSVANENRKDLVFTLFSSDVLSSGVYKPQLGIINVEAEAIQSSTVNASWLWRPPFILD